MIKRASRCRILIADDDDSFRETTRLLFEAEYAVLEASSSVETIRAVRAERPQLVLLDVCLPDMNGLETLRALKEDNENLRVLMLTGERDIDTARRALDLGATAYMTKPFESKSLRAEVRRLVADAFVEVSACPWKVCDPAPVLKEEVRRPCLGGQGRKKVSAGSRDEG